MGIYTGSSPLSCFDPDRKPDALSRKSSDGRRPAKLTKQELFKVWKLRFVGRFFSASPWFGFTIAVVFKHSSDISYCEISDLSAGLTFVHVCVCHLVFCLQVLTPFVSFQVMCCFFFFSCNMTPVYSELGPTDCWLTEFTLPARQ